MDNLRMRTVLAIALLAAAVTSQAQIAESSARTVEPSAFSLVSNALVEANASNRNVWVIFHASWCGWCKEMDKFMAVPANKVILEKYFVVIHVTVLESEANKHLENGGGDVLLAGLKGEGQGIPFFAFLDKSGSMLANSRAVSDTNKEGSNVGHPVQPDEIAWFMQMLAKGAPKMTAPERTTIETWLKSQKIGQSGLATPMTP